MCMYYMCITSEFTDVHAIYYTLVQSVYAIEYVYMQSIICIYTCNQWCQCWAIWYNMNRMLEYVRVLFATCKIKEIFNFLQRLLCTKLRRSDSHLFCKMQYFDAWFTQRILGLRIAMRVIVFRRQNTVLRLRLRIAMLVLVFRRQNTCLRLRLRIAVCVTVTGHCYGIFILARHREGNLKVIVTVTWREGDTITESRRHAGHVRIGCSFSFRMRC